MLINQPPDFKKVVLWPTQVKLLVLLCTVRSVKVKIVYAFYTNKIKCIFFKPNFNYNFVNTQERGSQCCINLR